MSHTERLESITSSQNIIDQPYIDFVKHEVPEQYILLSKNDFGKVPNRINIGAFNKKSNIRVSKDKSLMFYDKETDEVKTVSIKEVQRNQQRYFLIYKYIFASYEGNKEIDVTYFEDNSAKTIELTFQLGLEIGKILHSPNDEKLNNLNKDIDFIEHDEHNKLSINKNLIINSNPNFLIGILVGFFGNNKYYRIPNNINIYIFSTIFNLLGCSYSIRKPQSLEINEEPELYKNYSFIVRFKLPFFYFYKINEEIKDLDLNLDNILLGENGFFRKYKWAFLLKKQSDEFKKENITLKYIKNIFNLNYIIKNLINENLLSDFQKEVNLGTIELIPCTDIIFNKVPTEISEKNSTLYDYVMSNADAQNFNIPGLPWLKNSDGDLMAITAIYTKEASIEGDMTLSPANKSKFVNPTNGNIFTWGFTNDSMVGIYNATEEINEKKKSIAYNKDQNDLSEY